MSSVLEKIERELSPLVANFGCVIVRVKLNGSGRSKTLQIMIERENGDAANIEDCEKVSRIVSVKLDVMNPIDGHYNLEVSSTGIDRPLVKPKDFARFCGKPVVIKTYTSKNGCKIFKGKLDFASESGIKVVSDAPLQDGNRITELLYEEISSAHIDGFEAG
ncbi:MAG: ribosome maturation factor RimP [Alphaproteobacteria bacterium]|nr:ribosome maturation factor RimP [Alphaproteobacteria bacterium]